MKIYPYEGKYATGSYDYWMDGIVPYLAGFYDTYDDHRASAGIRVSGTTIRVSTQFGNTMLNGGSAYYYLMYTPCVEYNGTSYYYDQSWPDLTFTYNESTGVWTSDYGMFMAGAASNAAFSFDGYFQVVIPTITLTKTSDTTSLSVDDNRVAGPITDLELNFNVMAK